MKHEALHASLAGLLAALFIAAPEAYARGKPQPPAPPPPPPNNNAEWALINRSATDLSDIAATPGSIALGQVKVALLDGFTDCRHADLAGHCDYNLIQGGRYLYYDPHGTHTAGIIAGNTTGVAPGAKIINYAVFDDRYYVATGSRLINAWADAAGKGASIASMSFGCTKLALCFTAAEVNAMATTSMLFVKAAGNDGANFNNEAVAVTPASAFAAMERTILVGSVELSGTISSYSNRPGTGCLLPNGATSCSGGLPWMNYFMVAPGSSIYSTLPGGSYGLMSGTSMATPVVAGAAALLKAKWPTLQPGAIADILFGTATDLGADGVDAVYGHGLLNVHAALQPVGKLSVNSVSGDSTIVSGASFSSSPTFSKLATALGSVSVYDVFGRDFAFGETRLQLRRSYDTVHRLMGRRLVGLGSQSEWTSALFETKHSPLGFTGFGSLAEPATSAYRPDQTLRMGFDMPFKGGVAQLRMTGSSAARMDFAYDPSLKPLSFFASTALLKSSMFGQALLNVGANSRLALYGTTNAPGALSASAPGDPVLLRSLGERSTARLALTGLPGELRQQGFGAGYWTRPDGQTVIGVNASYLVQQGGYYDMASDMPGLDGTSRLFNLGAMVSRSMGSWELSAAGEVTNIRTSGATSPLVQLSASNIVSAELRLRKAGIAADGGALADSLSVALVMPPRAVSGTLRLDYMGPTADRLGSQAYSYRYALSGLGADPVKVEAGYQLTSGSGWSVDLTGGVNLRQSDYAGRGEALASFRMGF